MKEAPFYFEVGAAPIWECVSWAIKVANVMNTRIRFEFNKVWIDVVPGSDYAQVLAGYHHTMNVAKGEEYAARADDASLMCTQTESYDCWLARDWGIL